MSNNENKSSNKSSLYIAIITGLLILVAIIYFATRENSSSPVNNTNNSTTTPAPLSIIDEEGNQDETIKADIAIRDIEFGRTIKQIKNMENKLEDTLDNPTSATSKDGYTYLTYMFNPETKSNFFGADVLATDSSSMLVYVFYKDSLIEVRIQYGYIGFDAYNAIVAHNNNTYGKATYSRSYSNGTKQSWWKTEDVLLDVICQNGGAVAYYRKNK